MEARKLVDVLQDALNASKREFKQPKPMKQKHDVQYLLAHEAQYALNAFQDMINALAAIKDPDFSQEHIQAFINFMHERETLIENTPADYFQKPRSFANELYLTAARFIAEYAKRSGLGDREHYRLLMPTTIGPFSQIDVDKHGYLVAQKPSDSGYKDLKTRLVKRAGIRAFADRDHLIDHIATKVARSEWDEFIGVLMQEEKLHAEGLSPEQVKEYQEKCLSPFKSFALPEGDLVSAARNASLYDGNLRHDYAAIYLLAKLYSVDRSLQAETTGFFGKWTGYDRGTKLNALDVLMDYLASADKVEDLKPWADYLEQNLAVFVEQTMAHDFDTKVQKSLERGTIKDTEAEDYRAKLLDAEVKNIKGATGAGTVGWLTQQLGVIQKKYLAEQEKVQESRENTATLN